MFHPLLDADRIETPHREALSRIGEVFTVFDQQDSGNVSYGVRVGDDRFFVKTIGPLDQDAYLDAEGRSALLRNAADLARDVEHPALARFERLLESDAGPVLVYGWAEGELLHAARTDREDPTSAFQRFRALPAADIETVLDTLYDLHEAIAARGWVACDLYDGCFLYDFGTRRLTVMDLDTYHRGAFTNTMGRMFGATRFMAPEEHELGAAIDQRTTVFTLARLGLTFLSDGSTDESPWRGTPARLGVLLRATRPDPADRWPDVAAFVDAWRRAR